MSCEFENFCVIGILGGGDTCEGSCLEKERRVMLKKQKCPLMIRHRLVDSIGDCDLPFWLRAFVPNNISCANGNGCKLRIHFPELVSQAIAGKVILDRNEIIRLSGMIRCTIKASEQRGHREYIKAEKLLASDVPSKTDEDLRSQSSNSWTPR